MCRLMGAVFYDRPGVERNVLEIRNKLGSMLLIGELLNGGDGNGLAITKKTGEVIIHKTPNKAAEMVFGWKNGRSRMNKTFASLMDNVREASSVQLHTRLTTNGNSKNLANLHPFDVGNVVGCHNGTIHNFRVLWNKYPELGAAQSENDSEVIFAGLNYLSPDFANVEAITSSLREMSGLLAITATSKLAPEKFLIVSRDRPLVFYEDDIRGILWYASVEEILVSSGICREGEATDIKEEGFVVDTITEERVQFPVKKSVYTYPATPASYYRTPLPNVARGTANGTAGSVGANTPTSTGGGENQSTALVTVTPAPVEKPTEELSADVSYVGVFYQYPPLTSETVVVVDVTPPVTRKTGPVCNLCFNKGAVATSDLYKLYDDVVIENLVTDFFEFVSDSDVYVTCPQCIVEQSAKKGNPLVEAQTACCL